jgi:hypothetical protein
MKKLILLLIAVGAFWFYVDSERPDWFLKLRTSISFIDTTVSVDFGSSGLDEMSEEDVLDRFDHLYLMCAREPSNLGERVCWAYISRFNDLPAHMVAFFFDKGRLGLMRIEYPLTQHEALAAYLSDEYPMRLPDVSARDSGRPSLLLYPTASGFLATQQELKPGDKVLLTWQSVDKLRSARPRNDR